MCCGAGGGRLSPRELSASRTCLTLPLDSKIFLQPRERNEDRSHRALARPKRELAEISGGEHFTRGQTNRAAQIVLSAVQRSRGNGGRLFDPQKNSLARLRFPISRARSGLNNDVAVGGAFTCSRSVKLPEAVVDAIDLNVRGSPPALFISHQTVKHDQRASAAECFAESRVGLKLIGKLFSEEVR